MPDYYTIPARYLRSLFEEEDRLALVLINRENQLVEQRLVTVQQLTADRYLAHLRAANSHSKDIYVSMNPMKAEARGRTKADVREVKHIYLDIDKGGKPALDRIASAPGMPAPHHVLESSPDKFQAIYRVSGFMPSAAEATMRGLAKEFSADPAATDISRVLRVPGFRNWKYETPHYVRDTISQSPARIYTPADFPKYLERRQEPPAPTPRFGERHTPIDSGIDQSRKDYAFALRQLEQGVSPDVIRNKIADYRRPDGKHPNVEDYARRTVNSAQSHHARRGYTSVATTAEDRGGMER
ncbi:MAG: DNA-primase RepB domain-containing protein [Burkholderiales bacterium]